MALKNSPLVKHVIVTGNVMELNVYVSDALRRNPGYNIEKVVVLNVGSKEPAFSQSSVLSLLYVLLNENIVAAPNVPEALTTEDVEETVKEDKKVKTK